MSTEDPRSVCTCPRIDVGSFAVDGGTAPVYRLGRVDPRCPFHGASTPVSEEQYAEQFRRIGESEAEILGDELALDAAYARGISEGRRQATEGWERRLRWRTAEGSTWEFPHESYVAAYVKTARRMERQYDYAPGELQQRLVGPWEPAEQPEDDPLWAAEQAKRAKLAPLADFVVRTADEPRTRPRMTDGCGPEHTYREGCELRPEDGAQ